MSALTLFLMAGARVMNDIAMIRVYNALTVLFGGVGSTCYEGIPERVPPGIYTLANWRSTARG